MLLWELSLFCFAGLLREQSLFCLYSLQRIVVTSGIVPFRSPILQELSVLLTEGTIPFTFGGEKSLDAITFGNDPFSHWREISLCAKGTIPLLPRELSLVQVITVGNDPFGYRTDGVGELSLSPSVDGWFSFEYSQFLEKWFSSRKIYLVKPYGDVRNNTIYTYAIIKRTVYVQKYTTNTSVINL